MACSPLNRIRHYLTRIMFDGLSNFSDMSTDVEEVQPDFLNVR